MSRVMQSGWSVVALLKAVLRDRGGNMAVLTGLAFIPIVGAVGLAIDVSDAISVRNKVQHALDAAALAAAAKYPTMDVAYAKSFLMADLANLPIAPNAGDPGYAVSLAGSDFTMDADGVVTGTASVDVKTTFMGLAGFTTTRLNVVSTAASINKTKVGSATYNITNAQGAYDKDIYFFTRDKGGNILSETLILKYDYTLSKGKGSTVFTPPKSLSTTIKVGDYASYGYKMVVYEDNSYTGKTINPKSYYSDDPKSPAWRKITGDCTTGTSTENWEDGGDANYKDFVFDVTCSEVEVATGKVRLVQ
jgi:Flp pilus assembly protein TadG